MLVNMIGLFLVIVPLIIALSYIYKQKKRCIGCPLASQCHKKKR